MPPLSAQYYIVPTNIGCNGVRGDIYKINVASGMVMVNAALTHPHCILLRLPCALASQRINCGSGL